jgi:hypothetical protein
MKYALAARALVWVTVLSTSVVASGSPEDPPISTDRPGFLFAPTVLPRGRLQFETGLPTLTIARDAGDEVRTWTLPVDVRYGLAEKLELRASLPTWNDARDDSGPTTVHEDGFGDSKVGVKLQLPELSGGPLAFQASLSLPTGTGDFTTDELGGSGYLLHGRDLGDSYWLQAMLGATVVPIEGAHTQTAGAIAALVSHPIADRWSAYVEGTALPGLQNTPGQSYAGTALLFLAANDMQLDLSADFGLDDDSADVIAALGVSWRF